MLGGSIAPITQLPTEILTVRSPEPTPFALYSLLAQLIFIRCADFHDPKIFLIWSDENLRHCPLLLTLVCRSWRTLALSIPQLWAYLTIYPTNQRHVEILEKWIKLSGLHPLELALNFSPYRHDINIKVLQVVLKELHRLRSLIIEWADRKTRPVFGGVQLQMPLLEALCIHTPFRNEHDLEDQLVDDINHLLHDSPRLKSFEWMSEQYFPTGTHPVHSQSKIRLPWAQLTHIDLFCFLSLQDCITILSQCRLIETCSIYQVITDSSSVPIPSPITLPHLRSLYLNCIMDLSHLFDSFTLPALQELSITTVHFDWQDQWLDTAPEWHGDDFNSLLMRSRCAITSLSIDVAISAGDLLETMRLIQSSIESLSIRGVSHLPIVTVPLLLLLTRRPGDEASESLFPNLKKLRLVDCIGHLRDDVLADMIQSRSWVDVVLSVRLGDIPDGDMRRIENLKKDGLFASVEIRPLSKPSRSPIKHNTILP